MAASGLGIYIAGKFTLELIGDCVEGYDFSKVSPLFLERASFHHWGLGVDSLEGQETQTKR